MKRTARGVQAPLGCLVLLVAMASIGLVTYNNGVNLSLPTRKSLAPSMPRTYPRIFNSPCRRIPQRFRKDSAPDIVPKSSQEAVLQTKKQRRFAMNVVITGDNVAMATDEVTVDGDRLPLTNFQTWDVDDDADLEEQLSKFNAFLASRAISEAERIDIMAQTRQVLETLQGKPFVEACDALEELQDNIQIRDGKAIVRRLLSQKKMDVPEAFPTKILS
uniref:Uncharacterized protein n=1 Tax=Lotharella oceanica TaxID=641309 RepID=A0A7S2TQV5_9EUKA|mmetsp:Transcript_25815/g.48189  ORF Transcript_25815/g.48189 Transcript_25815/m.48189 type:complete len:218 (+) Transcript_25815:67-720(+)